LTAEKKLVGLQPLALDRGTVDGAPMLRLRGREYAAMSTGRVMRAAQAAFDFPGPEAMGAVRAGGETFDPRRLGALVAKKDLSAFEDTESGLLRLLYREVMVRFRPGTARVKREAIVRKFGLAVRARHPLVDDQVVLYEQNHRRSGAELVDVALEMAQLDEVAFATPNFVSQYRRKRQAKAAASISSAQWHLKTVGASRAWKTTRGSSAVVIAILDDGVDVEHPELRQNVVDRPDPKEPRDTVGRDFFLPDDHPGHFDPRPKRFRYPYDLMAGNDIHGTPCAGVAAGRGLRSYGLAPRCGILPVKIFHADDLAADAQVADAIRYAALHADVLSCSWSGPRSPDIEYALRDAMEIGRKGGAVIVCASGNEYASRVGFPASDPNCIAVGASTDDDEHADYSNGGKELWVVAPSSGGTRGIFATDVSYSGRGFNVGTAAAGGADGEFTNDFGGTSSATPLVAGLCGLLLSVDRKLDVARVREVLRETAVKIGKASSYGSSGHSRKYGYGRIDAAAAVAAVAAGKQGKKTAAANRRRRPAVAARRDLGKRRGR